MKSNEKYLWISIALTALACLIAVVMRLFSQVDLWFQIFAAIIGVIITAIITQVLLRGQTENDTKKEKDTKVFEEKLRIYQDFLHKLCDVIKDGRVTKEEARELQFQTAYITMHTNRARIERISKCVRDIIDCTVDQMDDGRDPERQSKNNKVVLDSLFVIVEQFKAELYQDEDSKRDAELDDKELSLLYHEAVDNFTSINADEEKDEPNRTIEVKLSADSPLLITPSVFTPQQEDTVVENITVEEKPSLEQNIKDFAAELEERLKSRFDRWKPSVQIDPTDGMQFCLDMKGYENKVSVCLSYENEQHYTQVHIDHPEYHDTYEFLKWKFGGRQNKWSWWQWLEGNWKYLLKSREMINRDWEQPMNYLVKQLSELMNWVERFMDIRTKVYLPLQKVDERASVRMRKNYLVIFDYTDDDRTFVDICQKDDGRYLIRMGNRKHDGNSLLAKVHSMRLPQKELDDEVRYLIVDDIPEESIVDKTKEFVKLIKL